MKSSIAHLRRTFAPLTAVALFVIALTSAPLIAADHPAPLKATVAQLAFLTGTWRGTSTGGTTAEEIISTAEGGVLLSTGREFKNGRCIFFDLVAFVEKDGGVLLIPHPNGKRSADVFPLTTLAAAAPRAGFENPAHDFPKKFVYELVSPDRLRITLTGERKGQPASEIFDLTRVK